MVKRPIDYETCLKSARMLVPKFHCEDADGVHIQWPKDDPLVIKARDQAELVELLSERLLSLGRVSNQGPHVKPENGCPSC